MRAKMPESQMELWLWPIVLAVVCVSACWFSRKNYWLAGPFALFLLYQGWSLLYTNLNFSGELLSTFGVSYWLQFAATYALPLISIAIYGTFDFRGKNRRPRNIGFTKYLDD